MRHQWGNGKCTNRNTVFKCFIVYINYYARFSLSTVQMANNDNDTCMACSRARAQSDSSRLLLWVGVGGKEKYERIQI